ncbi:MAG: sulfatase-like hydrolase/transferase [Methylococcaceae bacterium]|jgi:hypothetical protein
MRMCSQRVKLTLAGFVAATMFIFAAGVAAKTSSTPKNILFIIMDDVGIDQMGWYASPGPQAMPAMPNISGIANQGIRFRNNWSMPACSPSRAVFFEGRFPMRSNVMGALGPYDAANSMVSPFDYTAPKLLKERKYKSALFGKFHLGLQGNSPDKEAMPRSLGWDYYYGWLDETGDPQSIDLTAGGVGGSGGNGKSYACGYVPGANYDGGADSGACYAADSSCENMTLTSASNPPGRICRDRGGIFNPGAACVAQGSPMPANISAGFQNYNAHFVSPLWINDEKGKVYQVPVTDKRARTYRGTAPVDAAIAWIKGQKKDQPWMATVSFATDHTPLQPPPIEQLPPGSTDTTTFNCADSSNWPVLSNQMIEAMDHEVGRLLVETGLATEKDGVLVYQPKMTNTMIVVVGDNGSLGNTVKLPFDPTRAKGTSYQTGVWVPLMVAGPMVVQPGRDVKHMTNIADIYQLFGEIAGIDVHKVVPWHVDAKALMPYIKNPQQASIRKWNFNQIAPNLQPNGTINGPCVMSGGASCSQIPVNKSVCEDNGGVWWGEGAQDSDADGPGPVPETYCCNVNIYLTNYYKANNITDYSLPSINSLASMGIRNNRYKLVINSTNAYDATTNSCVMNSETREFYEINENKKPRIDLEKNNLLADGAANLTPDQKRNYAALTRKLGLLLKTDVDCEGDGNLDGVVNQKDMAEWEKFSKINDGLSSWYDFNLDGLTNESDYQIIQQNFGTHCKPGKTAMAPAKSADSTPKNP